MFGSKWFMTLFSYDFPFVSLVRIWDIFLFEGWKIVYRIALATLKLNEGICVVPRSPIFCLKLNDLL